MKKSILLLLLCGFTSYVTAQSSTPPLFEHLQTLFGNSMVVINDSMVLSVAKSSPSTNSKAYSTLFNVRSKKWAHLGGLPDSVGSFARAALDANGNGVLGSISGKLFFSNDGFQNFTEIILPFSTPQTQSQRRLLKVHNGYLAQYQLSNSNHFYHSTNGTNWTYTGEEGGGAANYLNVVNDSLYYLSTSNSIHKNANGGLSFPGRNLNITLPFQANFFRAVTDSLWFVGNNNGFQRSTNGGQSWAAVSLPPGSVVNAVVFKDSLTGVITLNGNGGSYITTDGGANFQLLAPGQNVVHHFIGNTLFRGSGSGGIFGGYSDDLGQTYTNYERISITTINDISFHGQTGLIVGSGGYAISRDGGYSFTMGASPLGSGNNFSCTVVNDTLMLVGNFTGEIYRSADAGLNWTRVVNSTGNNSIFRFKTDGPNRILVVRNFAAAMYSSDGGLTFFNLPLASSKMFAFQPGSTDMRFLSISQANGIELRSATFPPPNSNSTIVSTITPGNFEAVDLNIADAQTSYVLGEEGTEKIMVYRSTNGGNSWTKMSSAGETGMNLGLNGLKFQSMGSQKLGLVQYPYPNDDTTYQKIYTSNDGGSSWQLYRPVKPLGADLFFMRSIHFFDTDKFMVGFRGGRLMLNAFADGSGSASSTAEIPAAMRRTSLVVYPNPSREWFYLKLSEEQNYRIEIRNIQGSLLEVRPIHTASEAITHNLQPGIYLIHAIGNDNNYNGVGRLVVQ